MSTRKKPSHRGPAKKRVDGTSAKDAQTVKGSTSSDAIKDSVKDAPGRRRAEDTAGTRGSRRRAEMDQSPRWLVPLALALLIIGLFYLVTYYLSTGALPLAIGDWNLAVGFGLMMVGGGLLMFWK